MMKIFFRKCWFSQMCVGIFYSKRPTLPRFEDLALVNSTVNWGGVWSVVDSSWPPVRLGIYARPLRRWLRRFPRSRILFISGERLVVDPAFEMARVQVQIPIKWSLCLTEQVPKFLPVYLTLIIINLSAAISFPIATVKIT